ncbi:MAG: RNA methyltransferase [Planctomycetota bacterium]|jgi:tRNA/rRNA methyltransferase|nr:RNA methyltransferase [Planctomycetota bacterium]
MQALSDVVVVLARTQGPINLGLVSRACANMGVGELRLVNPICEPDCDEARKFANHARDDLLLQAPVFTSVAAATTDRHLVIGTTARVRDGEHGAPMAPAAAAKLARERGADRVALVFGNEADGLNDEELRDCNLHLHLETPGPYPSYNLSHAVAISLYQWGEAWSEPAPPVEELCASREAVARLERYWLGSLERFRYFRRTPLEQWRPQFQSLVGRMHLTEHDVVVIRGMLSQMNYIAFGDKADDMDQTGRAPADNQD